MNRFLSIPIVLLSLGPMSSQAIAQTEIPNTFQSGQPARAAEVNENFEALATAANDNATAIQGLQGLSGLSRPAAEIQSGLKLTSGLRWAVADFYASFGYFPPTNPGAGAGSLQGTDWSNNFVSSSSITHGAIRIRFSDDADASIAGAAVDLVPHDPGSGVIWFECVGDGVTDEYLDELDCAFSDEPWPVIAIPRSQVIAVNHDLTRTRIREAIEDYYYANSNTWPTSNAELGIGLAQDYSNDYLEQIEIGENGVIQLSFGYRASSSLLGRTIVWTPTDTGYMGSPGLISWECSSVDIADRFLTPDCR